MKTVTFKTHEVQDGPVLFQETLEPGFLGLDDEAARDHGPVEVDLEAMLDAEGSVIVTGKLKATPELHCGKCAKWFRYPVVVKGVAYHFEKPLPSVLDLTEQIREDIVLQLPMAADCSLPNASTGQPGMPCEVPSTGTLPTLRGKEVWSALDDIKLEE